MQPTGIALD